MKGFEVEFIKVLRSFSKIVKISDFYNFMTLSGWFYEDFFVKASPLNQFLAVKIKET